PDLRTLRDVQLGIRLLSRSRGSLLVETRGVAITLVAFRELERRQPGLPTNDPVLVSWQELIGGIQASQMHFDLILAARKNGRAAARAEEAPPVLARFAFDRHRAFRKDRRRTEDRTMVLAAVETVTNANSIGTA